MKSKIVIKDNEKGIIEIPISLKEMRDAYDGMHICMDEKDIAYKNLKLNKVDKGFFNFHEKLHHIVHDIIHDGKVYELAGKDKLKFKLSKKRHYFIRKPHWKK
ncbi:MAG TPA: hypothetical protein VJK51_00565 [Candidatus Nanoarchaeia archaeon]|nr:hypothetical protein [Candidatus Nanoarchaeia archaeon]